MFLAKNSPRTSGKYPKREESSFLGIQDLFEVGNGCDLFFCDIYLYLLHYISCMYVNIALLITPNVRGYGRITICHESPLACTIMRMYIVIVIVVC